MAFLVPMAATALGASAGTAATLGTIASVAGTAFSIFGALKSAQGQKESAAASAASDRYNAQVAANNAKIAKQNAAWAGQQGNMLVGQQQMKNRAAAAELESNQAASGVRLDSKSFTDVRSSAKEQGELSAIDIRTKAARQAYGFEVEAGSHMADATLDRAQAGFDLDAGDTEATGTILGGLSSSAMGYANYMTARGL